MNATLIGAIILIAGAGLGIVVLLIFQRWAKLEQRVKDLEECKQKRLTHNLVRGLEDATAVNLDLDHEANELEIQARMLLKQAKVLRKRNAQGKEILNLLRGGPDNYDPERPAGPRPRVSEEEEEES